MKSLFLSSHKAPMRSSIRSSPRLPGLRIQSEALHSPRATQPAPGTHRGKPVVPNTGARAAHVQPTPSADRIDNVSHTYGHLSKAKGCCKKVKTH